MKFFKENPVFSIVLLVLLLAFAGGVYMDYHAYLTSGVHGGKESKAKQQLRSALALSPAPTQANLDAAKANVQALKQSLAQQIETTKGTKPELLAGEAPKDGTQMLFNLRGYRETLAREAAKVIPINVNEKSVGEGNIPNPGVKIADNFAFGFSRYLDSGVPPKQVDVAKLHLQEEILKYVTNKLLETRPIEIRAIQREPVEAGLAVKKEEAKAKNGRRAPRRPSQEDEKNKIADEFKVGRESAAVKGAVETIGFRLTFTGYTENLRQFMKALEAFELPLVVRSVAVKPLGDAVRAQNKSRAPGANSFDAIFGTVEQGGKPAAESAKKAQEPVVAENISEFTVVIEYINVVLKNAN